MRPVATHGLMERRVGLFMSAARRAAGRGVGVDIGQRALAGDPYPGIVEGNAGDGRDGAVVGGNSLTEDNVARAHIGRANGAVAAAGSIGAVSIAHYRRTLSTLSTQTPTAVNLFLLMQEMVRVTLEPSASCASREDPMRQVRRRRATALAAEEFPTARQTRRR